MGLAVIIMGSRSDLEHANKVVSALAVLGVRSELRVGSAHKSPEHVMALIREYEARPEPKVYLTIAGRSNALSGLVDAMVTAPVIACPVYSDHFAGADVFSSLRMPSGVAPALVLDPAGAALLTAKVLGLGDDGVRARIATLQRASNERILQDDASVLAESQGR